MSDLKSAVPSSIFSAELSHWRRRLTPIFGMIIALGIMSCSSPIKQAAVTFHVPPECSNELSDQEVANRRGISLEQVEMVRAYRGLYNRLICSLPDAKLARHIKKANEPKAEFPAEARAQRLMVQQDEHGNIPADAYAKAQQQVRDMRAAKALTGSSSVTGMSPENWTSVGPGNVGGRSRSLLIHPVNTNKMWLGSVTGGIWTTDNGGTSWAPVDDFMANLTIASMAMDPVDPQIMYVGTGEAFRGAGIFKSIDGGVIWDQLPATANSSFYYVKRLAISPTDHNVILAGTSTGLWRSADAGNTWTQTGVVSTVMDVDFHPSDGNRAIAGGYSGKAYYTVDAGQTWFQVDSFPAPPYNSGGGRIELAYALSDPDIVYASFDKDGAEVWGSIDGGHTYVPINTGNGLIHRQGGYDNIIWVDPTDSQIVIVGGVQLHMSYDGGVNFQSISSWNGSHIHVDHHMIVAHPDFDGGVTNATVFFTNDGGIYKAENLYEIGTATGGWQELNNTLAITQFYAGAGNGTTGMMIGGTQDNNTLRYTGDSEAWDSLICGDGGFTAIDPVEPNYLYMACPNLSLQRSHNGGATIESINPGITALFIAPFILDPNDPTTLLAGGDELWRTTDARANSVQWSSITPDFNGYVSALAVAPGNSDIIWIGYTNGNVYMTNNGTDDLPFWVQVDNNALALPNRYVTRIAIDPIDNNKVYATFGGYLTDTVWRSLDSGLSWENITGTGVTSLPDVPVRSLVIHPKNSDRLYVGTEIGVFASEDGGMNWDIPDKGPANVGIDELFWIGDKQLVAATYGRGMFTTIMPGEDVAEIVSPLPNAVLSGSSETFSWTDAGATQYFMDVGTAVGTSDILSSGSIPGTETSLMVNNLPTDGSTVYVRMWSYVAGAWHFVDNTYTGAGGPARIILPIPGAALNDDSQTFIWTNVGAVQYRLTLGSTVGGTDYHDVTYTGTMADVTGLPTDGTPIHARLWAGTLYADYTYSAPLPATMISPTAGSIFTDTTVTFTWSDVGASEYRLTVGTWPGHTTYHDSTQAGTSATVSGLPSNGSRIGVRLWTGQLYKDYTYTARQGAASLQMPAPGSTLTFPEHMFSWEKLSWIIQYRLQIGSTLGATDIYDSTFTDASIAAVSGLPTDGRTLYVTLSSLLPGDVWESNSYMLTAVDTSTHTGVTDLSIDPAIFPEAPVSVGRITEFLAFITNNSSVDVPNAQVILSEFTPDGPILDLEGNEYCGVFNGSMICETGPIAAGQEGYAYVAISPVQHPDIYTATSTIVLPGAMTDSNLVDNVVVGALNVVAAEISSPVPGSVLSGDTETFQWNDLGFSSYRITVGTTAGGTDIHDSTETATSVLVSGLPTDGSTVYVRLWTNGVYANDYSYTASSSPDLPPAPANLTATEIKTGKGRDATYSHELSWDAVTEADSYNVYQGASSSGPWNLLPSGTGIGSTTYSEPVPRKNTLYFYVVTAVNEAGESTYSNWAGSDGTTGATGPVPLVITTTSLPDGSVNGAYLQTLQASGGTTPYGWSLISGVLPTGLALHGSTGLISGTPIQEEIRNFTVRVTDDAGDSDDQGLTINIGPESTGIATPTNLTASERAAGKNYFHDLAWDAVSGATEYLVYESPDTAGPWIYMSTETTNSVSKRIGKSSMFNCYVVTASDEINPESDYSNWACSDGTVQP